MLRAAVLLLLLLNAVFFVWTQGWLDTVLGDSRFGAREPERLLRQINPDRVRLVSPGEASGAGSSNLKSDGGGAAGGLASGVASGSAGGFAVGMTDSPAAASAAERRAECLEAGPFDNRSIAAAEAALAPLPAGSWQRVSSEGRARHIVYMGRFADTDALRKKSEELSRLKLPHQAVSGAPELQPGLSLGSFDTRAAAESALATLANRGVRTARVATLSADSRAEHRLRIAQADAGLASSATAIKFSAPGAGFRACVSAAN